MVSAAYVGTKAQDLATSRQINPAVYGPGATLANRQQRRLYPQFESIMSFDPIGRSEYHGMQLSVNKRFSRGYSILANYTLSKAKDNASNDDGFSPQDPLDPMDTWGLGNSDQRHRLVTSVLWELPSPQARGGKSRARRLAAQQHRDAFRGHAVHRQHRPGHDAEFQYVTRECHQGPEPVDQSIAGRTRSRGTSIRRRSSIPVDGTFGNTPRNFLIGPGSRNVDLSLFRTFALRQDFRLQFRIEAFNAFNFVNLGNPQGNITVATAGQILSAGDARVMQLGLRMTF